MCTQWLCLPKRQKAIRAWHFGTENPKEVFSNQTQEGERVKRFRAKREGGKEKRERQKTGETENAINCEGHRVRGQSSKRIDMKGEREYWQEMEKMKSNMWGWADVSVWCLINSSKKKKTWDRKRMKWKSVKMKLDSLEAHLTKKKSTSTYSTQRSDVDILVDEKKNKSTKEEELLWMDSKQQGNKVKEKMYVCHFWKLY